MRKITPLKNHPKWKQYEWLVAKIFHEELSSYNTNVIYDSKLDGQFSERSRQIDVLVKNSFSNIKTIIECKFRSRKLDVKDIETFLGMYQDVKASNGILISPLGFTKTAYTRISQFKGKIKLEVIDWEKAYETNNNQGYNFRLNDICSSCLAHHDQGQSIPGIILWNHGIGFEVKDKISVFSVGECMKCKAVSVYCDSCGVTTIASKNESCCDYQAIIYSEFKQGNI